MGVNYTEIDRVGKLAANFKQVPFVQSFWNFYNVVVKTAVIKIVNEK